MSQRLICVLSAMTMMLCMGLMTACVTPPSEPLPGEVTEEVVIVWTDALDIGLENQGWTDTANPYDRYPARAEGVVREPVWELAHHSAGLAVRFVTDSPSIHARWTLRNENLAMFHMPATGVSGLDLYARDGDIWRYVGIARPRHSPTNEVTLIEDIPSGPHEYLMYLPLYNGVRGLEIGIAEGARIAPAPPRPESHTQPLCFYGTSITQGGCASRPGMAYAAILGRRLGREAINLGFSGNGKMEPEVADLLAELDPAVYVLNALPNMEVEMVDERVVPFVHTLRATHPDTPIVLIENFIYQGAWFEAELAEEIREKNEALHRAFDALVAEGVTGIHLVESANLLGHDGEPAVDGVHLTDLGFFRMADSMEPILRDILGE
ncbi:SGNH/GDSL hydrolase family protein [Candidatus Sumerlaeota bacterium]|nr:SGNH/GDSL hydrolase family protein [Candidatus Sumerlaeota bacterium]